MNKFNHREYRFRPRPWDKPPSGSHHWQIVGPVGGVSFHVTFWNDGEEPSCGLEFHHSARWHGHADRFGDEAAHHLRCDVIGEPCWHDGTSLYASETLWPSIRYAFEAGDHWSIFRALEREYSEQFERRDRD